MPLKLTAGVSKKLGLPGYSSVGAICHVELELDSRLIQQDPEAFCAQVREVYAQCAESVDEELARHQAPRNQSGSAREIAAETRTGGNGPNSAKGRAGTNGNGHAQGDRHGNGYVDGNGHPPGRGNARARCRPSARQLDYVQELAGRLGMAAEQIEDLCQRLFKKPLAELSGGLASAPDPRLAGNAGGLAGPGRRLSP